MSAPRLTEQWAGRELDSPPGPRLVRGSPAAAHAAAAGRLRLKLDDAKAHEIAEANGVPIWAARFEPVFSWAVLALALAATCLVIAMVAWTLGLLLS